MLSIRQCSFFRLGYFLNDFSFPLLLGYFDFESKMVMFLMYPMKRFQLRAS